MVQGMASFHYGQSNTIGAFVDTQPSHDQKFVFMKPEFGKESIYLGVPVLTLLVIPFGFLIADFIRSRRRRNRSAP